MRKAVNSVFWQCSLFLLFQIYFSLCKGGSSKSGTMMKLLPLGFLTYHIEFHEGIKTPFTVCKYLY